MNGTTERERLQAEVVHWQDQAVEEARVGNHYVLQRNEARARVAVLERQMAAIEVALEVEGWVVERGRYDAGVQAACQRVRAAMADPDAILDPKPAAGVVDSPKETRHG